MLWIAFKLFNFDLLKQQNQSKKQEFKILATVSELKNPMVASDFLFYDSLFLQSNGIGNDNP